MAKMVSPAGDMEVRMLGFRRDGDKLLITGQMGVWNAKIYIGPGEVVNTFKLMLNFSMLRYAIMLPFIYFKDTSNKQK